MKYTKNNLKKTEDLLKELDYTIRYEKGNFKSGYCIVESRKIAVINKFFDFEAKMNVLLDVLTNLEVEEQTFSPESSEFYLELKSSLLKKRASEN